MTPARLMRKLAALDLGAAAVLSEAISLCTTPDLQPDRDRIEALLRDARALWLETRDHAVALSRGRVDLIVGDQRAFCGEASGPTQHEAIANWINGVALALLKQMRRADDALAWWPDALDDDRWALLLAAWGAVQECLADKELPDFSEMVDWLKTETRAAMNVAPTSVVTLGAKPVAPPKPDIHRAATLEGLMLEEMRKNANCWTWTTRKWAAFTGYSNSAVGKTAAWQMIIERKQTTQVERAKEQAEREGRAFDRRRNGKKM